MKTLFKGKEVLKLYFFHLRLKRNYHSQMTTFGLEIYLPLYNMWMKFEKSSKLYENAVKELTIVKTNNFGKNYVKSIKSIKN